MIEIILGPPGTGKTTTLIGLVREELRHTPPSQIGYVSFTRKAANEAMERALRQFPKLDRKDFQFFSTIHALCFRQLGMKRGEVLEGARMKEFARYAGIRINQYYSEDGTTFGYDTGDRILFMINLARINMLPLRAQYDLDSDGLDWSEVERVDLALRRYKKETGYVDFTDMLQMFVQSGIRLGLKALLVDETQDLSRLQWAVVHKLAEGCQRMAVAGDDDQAIYLWAGADVRTLIEMTGGVRVLAQSYRVPPAVQAVTGELIGRMQHRRAKLWHPRKLDRKLNETRVKEGLEPYTASGSVGQAREFEDVDCDGSSVLILARNTYILNDYVAPELRRRGILFERNGNPSIKERWLTTIRNWESLRRGGTVTLEEARGIYGLMRADEAFKRGNKTLSQFGEEETTFNIGRLRQEGGLLTDKPWHEALGLLPQDDVAYIRAARARGEKFGNSRVTISTIHGAKGGEADHVVVMKEMAGRSYEEMVENPEDEARVWYVAVTRAKERLTIVGASHRAKECPWL